MTKIKSTGKNRRVSVADRVQKFGDLAGRIDIAAISALSESDPQAAHYVAQQMEQRLLQEQAEHNERIAKVVEETNATPGEELENQMSPELQMQLSSEKKHQLKSIQELKTEIENKIRQRYTPTPRPGAGG